MEIFSYKVKEYDQPTKRYCKTLELKNDCALIEEYKKLHSHEEHQKLIRDGIRSVGILEMEIYIHKNKLFMIMETPLDFDYEGAMSRLAGLPGQAEWEQLVDKYQACKPGSASSEKWQLMERMFFLYEDDEPKE